MCVSYDWIESVDLAHELGLTDGNISDDSRFSIASKDFQGILKSDVFVLLAESEDEQHGVGSFVELGAASMISIFQPTLSIFVSGGNKRTIFTVPGIVEWESPEVDDDRLFERLIEEAEKQAGNESP